jgi:hypothetical protein
MKSRIMRLAGHVAHGKRSTACRIFVRKTKGKRPLGRSGIGEKKQLKFIFKKWDCGPEAGLIWLRIEAVGGLL